MGFLELRRQCGVSHEVPRGSQGVHSSCELELGIALQSLQGKIDIIYACVHRHPRGPIIQERVPQMGRPHAATLSGSPDLLKGPSKGQELLASGGVRQGVSHLPPQVEDEEACS